MTLEDNTNYRLDNVRDRILMSRWSNERCSRLLETKAFDTFRNCQLRWQSSKWQVREVNWPELALFTPRGKRTKRVGGLVRVKKEKR